MILLSNDCPVINSGILVEPLYFHSFPNSNKTFVTIKDLENFNLNHKGQKEDIISTILYKEEFFCSKFKIEVLSEEHFKEIMGLHDKLGYTKLTWFYDKPNYILFDHLNKTSSSFIHNPSSDFTKDYLPISFDQLKLLFK